MSICYLFAKGARVVALLRPATVLSCAYHRCKKILTPMMLRTFLALVLFSSSAWPAAKSLTGKEIESVLRDRTVAGDGWTQAFRSDGSTTYNSARGGEPGSWEVRADEYCSVWPPSLQWSCYVVTLDGEKINFISNGGDQYPGRLLPR